MAIYVDLLPVEEQAITLATFFNNLQIAKDGGKSDENEKQFAAYQDLIAKRDLKQLLLQLTQQHELVFAQAEEKDIETCWSTICSLARNIKQEDVRDVVLAIIQIVSSNTASATLLRLRILNNLYNYLPANSTAKYDILLAILNYALATQNSAVIKPFYGRIGEWVNQWELTNAQKRTIYDLLFRLSELTSPGSRAGYELLLKSLLTFEDGENLQDGLGAAKEAAIRAIKLADVHQCDDLLEMKAIKQLQSNAETAPLFELLSLFATDKLEAFEQFVASNPQFLASVGLSQDDCSTKIRLLSLASLASAHSELSYAVIAQTLRVGENDVENWVIQAISAELLDAKLDQLTKTVSIHRCTQRVFTGEQWSLLSQKLNGWQKNIQNILQVLQSSHGRRSA